MTVGTETEKTDANTTAPKHWEQVTRKEAYAILMSLVLCMFLSALDQTITAVALPQIVAQLGGVDKIAWVTAAYLLTSTALLPLYGKFSDIYGRMPVYLFALVSFEIGSALCGASVSIWMLIVSRGVQGIGGAGLIELSVTIMSDVFPQEQVAKYSAFVAAVFGISSVLGPVIGGLFTDAVSWRWVFWINLPLGAIAVPSVFLCMRKIRNAQKEMPVDIVGSFVIMAAVVCLVFPLTVGGSSYAWNSGLVIGLFVAGGVLLVLFVLQEARHPEPLILLPLFKIRNFALVQIFSACYSVAFLGVVSFIGLYFQYCLNMTAIISGLATLPFTAGMMFGAPTAGIVLSKYKEPRYILTISAIIFGVGVGLLYLLTADIAYWKVALILFTIGLGGGAPVAAAPFIAQGSVEKKDIAVAVGAASFFRAMGGCIGVAIYQSIFNDRLEYYIKNVLHFPYVAGGGVSSSRNLPPMLREAFAYALSRMFVWGVPFVGVCAICAFFFTTLHFDAPQRPQGTDQDELAPLQSKANETKQDGASTTATTLGEAGEKKEKPAEDLDAAGSTKKNGETIGEGEIAQNSNASATP